MTRTEAVRWSFRLHRWTGVLVGVPLAVILLSGTVAVFKDEIDEWLNPRLLVVEPRGERIPLDEPLRAVQREGLPIVSVELPDEEHRPYLFLRRDRDNRFEHVAVDPYSGERLGARPANGHLADVLRQLHVRFYFFGATGRIVVGLFGVLLTLSGVTGIFIYWRFIRGQRWYQIRAARGAQWAHSDVHKLFGVTTLAVNLLWAVTGAVLGLENLTNYYRPAQKYLHPSPTVRVSSSALTTSLDGALAAARGAIAGFQPRSVSLPSGRHAPLTVYGNTAGTWTAPTSSWVALDPVTGTVLQVHDERRAHMVTRVYNLHDPLHFGYFGGIWTRWLWFLTGLAVSALPVTGLALWLLKLRHRKPASRNAEETVEHDHITA